MKKKVKIFAFENNFGYLEKIQEILLIQQVDCELRLLPNFWIDSCTTQTIQTIAKKIDRDSAQNFIIFAPNTTELFCLENVDFTITFSAYKTWYNSDNMEVIPHLWTPNKPPEKDTSYLWQSKPSLSVGFMGKSYNNSRAVRSLTLLPMAIKQWLLKGHYLRNQWLIKKNNDLGSLLTYANAFSRFESLKVLEKISEYSYSNDFVVDIIATDGRQLNSKSKENYINHLKRNTYVLCPRGSENYSFRFYEALNYGRVPILIDTDMVLPPGINWEEIAIIIDYDNISNLRAIIARDYQNCTEDDFIIRQQKAIQTMKKLQEMNWIDDICNKILSKINNDAQL